MLNVKKTLTKVLEKITAHDVDYIVDEGTSGDSTYRKWNSGLAECWGTATNGSNGACSVTFPLTFTARPVCIASCCYLSSGTYVAPTVAVQPNTTGVNFYVRVATSVVTQAHIINYEAKGTWK